ncbi:MAG: hypothetical protein KatS3mg114_1434 [Planctomycetaceae bacterium]|nr:MAG: hypothetical protein KatS3mg114_1434 [Planctomycetaceae bacterium]
MVSRARAVLLAFFWLSMLGGPTSVQAQLPQTQLFSVFPPGASAGSEVRLTLTSGADLEEVKHLVFSHAGITAQATEQPLQFRVQVAADVPPGVYAVRCLGLWGLSNPRCFVVSSEAEILEQEPNNKGAEAQPLAFHTVCNGRISGATDADHYRLTLTAGERVLIRLQARQIDSRLDGVLELYDPAGRRVAMSRQPPPYDPVIDFTPSSSGEYLLKVYDFVYGGGEEYTYRVQMQRRPHVDYVWPAAVRRGQEQTVTLYGRLLPGGEAAGLMWEGKPLEKVSITLTAPSTGQPWTPDIWLGPQAAFTEGFLYAWSTPQGTAPPVWVGLTDWPVVLEQEPNDGTQPQSLTLPVEVSGQFQTPGDTDVYIFEAQSQQVWMIDVWAARHGSPADPVLWIDQRIQDAQGNVSWKRLGSADDDTTNLLPNVFPTQHDDPVYRFVAPAEGVYRITLRDRYFSSRGDARLQYRLQVRHEQPDYRVVVLPLPPSAPNQPQGRPWAVGLRRGDQQAVQVLVYRRDGFNDEVRVWVEGLPAGVGCREILVGTNPSSGRLVFEAEEQAAAWHGTVRVLSAPAHPRSDPPPAPQPAQRGEIVWPGTGQLPPISRLAHDLELSVWEESAPVQLKTEVHQVVMHHQSQLLIPVKLIKREGFDANVNLQFVGQPPNSQVENKGINKDKGEEVYRLFVPPNVPVGTYVLTLSGQVQVSYRRNPAKLERAQAALEQATAALMQAEREHQQTQQLVQDLTQQRQQAQEQLKAREAESEMAQQQLKEAQKALAVAQQAVERASDEQARQDAEKQRDTAQQRVKQAEEQVSRAAEQLKLAQQALQTIQTQKTQAEEQQKQRELTLKQAQQQKMTAEKGVKDAENATKPQNVNIFPTTTPIVVTIKPAPVTLNVQVPNNGKLKRGEKLELKVEIKRQHEFTGPVAVQLFVPPGVRGLTADPVTIPADQTTATLVVMAAGDAPEGQPAYLTVRATADFGGPAAVDQPLTLNIIP